MKVVVWNEFFRQNQGKVKKAYPTGMHNALKSIFDEAGIDASTAILEEPEHGLTQEVLDKTDVLLWWGHGAHDKVSDEVVDRVCKRVADGMGMIFLHSAHFSKPFKKMMGTSCSLRWREKNEPERVWTVMPTHPIASGIPQGFRLPREEMYGEHFDIPQPDDVVFVGWFEGGEVFRSGCTFTYGKGRIFYLQCGHETFPIYYDTNVRHIILNATRWANNQVIVNNFEANSKCIHASHSPERLKFHF